VGAVMRALALALAFPSSVAAASEVMRFPSDVPGPAGASDAALRAAVSGNGRFVAFTSAASNLVPNDTDGRRDIFVFDLATSQIRRESVLAGGVDITNTAAEYATLSFDGRVVVFATDGPIRGLWLRDRIADTTTFLSGGGSGQYEAIEPQLSLHNRYVLFKSNTSDLVPSDNNGASDVFLYDRELATIARISNAASPFEADGASGGARMSGDARWIAYASVAQNLVQNDVNGSMDVFVLDRSSGTLTRESVDSNGIEGNGHSGGFVFGPPWFVGPSISDDGRYVVFESQATNLVPNDTNNKYDVFLRDRNAGTTTRISMALGGAQCDGDSHDPRITPDGRFVVYCSRSTSMFAGDTLLWDDVFVFDRIAGTTSLASPSISGIGGNSASTIPAISNDGRIVAFQSVASDLVPNDDNGQVMDVFALDRNTDKVPYCFGDGSGTTCPCGNFGAAGRGCDNSLATGGARLDAQGSAFLTADTLELTVDGMPPATTCLFLEGNAATNGGLGAPFGDGLRCAGGVVVRLGIRPVTSGVAHVGAPAGDPPISVTGGVPAQGGTFFYQVWYRNVAAFCSSAAFNLSNGVSVTWSP
jgi:Tol biopolymer transport system component